MPLLSPFSKATCPYCFAQFHLSKAPRRHVEHGASTEPCSLVQKHFGMSAHVVLPKIDRDHLPKTFWSRVGRTIYVPPEPHLQRSVCPACGIYLPEGIANGELSSEVIAIVGARSSGKSNYFGVLLHDLRKRISGQLGFDIVDAKTFTPSKGPVSSSILYQERYGRLFDPSNPRAVEQTASTVTTRGRDNDPRIPLIYQLRFKKHSWQHLYRPFDVRLPVYLLIFDAAGEDMADETIMQQYYTYLERATGILFLVDPFEYPGVRKQLPAEVQRKLKPIHSDPAWVVDHVLNTIRNRRHASSSRLLNIPAAFVLTKSDLFQKIPGVIHTNSAISRESAHHGGYDVQGCESLSSEVQQHIINWDSRELVDKAQSNFRTHQFFAISALGDIPGDDMKLSQLPQPRRVADPLIWLLWKRGYIPSIRRV